MRLAAAECWIHEFQLAEPYTIAYQTYDRATNYFLRVTDPSGLHGFGCASPAEEVTGESFVACEAALQSWCNEAGSDRGRTAPLDEAGRTPAAAAAIDMALLDLEARRRSLPLYAMLGGSRAPLRTSITVGISPLEQTRARAAEYHRQGFTAFKVKGGRDAELDAERVLALRDDLGPDVDLRFDANQGYSLIDAIRFADKTRAAALSVIEQPTAAAAPETLSQFRAGLSVSDAPGPALLADEAAIGLKNTVQLIEGGAVDGVVVKLMKCGGIRAAREIDRVAAQHSLRCMLSCMDEAALAIAAALHFALAARTCAWIDLDGHLDLLDDPSCEAVRLDCGRLLPAAGPGLGVSVSPA